MYRHKPILVILVWGLIIEVIVMVYYFIKGYFAFEFYLNLFLIFFTLLGIYLIFKQIVKEIRKR
ncbi:MAG: hypothetical protein PWQ20_1694 [Thermotogaceae bacterium]|jgi:hypothetical protein|nr:hypothetical protein [Thermotogaceae bacterium]MDN5338624.1 hypothetical protein [Thermotogaceae bacterium]